MVQHRFPDQLIETIRDRSDLISVVSDHVALKKSGRNFTGLCPFHSEKTPSFVVSPAKQIFHCFGCGAGGNVIQFLIKMEGLSFPEALRRLAEKAGVPLPVFNAEKEPGERQESDQIYQLNAEAAVYFHENLVKRPEANRALAYLKDRGITRQTIETFSIGFALPLRQDLFRHFCKRFPAALLEKGGLISRKGDGSYPSEPFDRFRNRIIFPIRTLQGKVVGFGGRVLDDALPKYLNSPETPVFTKGRHLFGIDQAKGKSHRSLMVVEGYFDAIALHQAGIPNVVATLGTALTPEHLQLVRRVAEKVILIFDPDRAGIQAALRAAPLFIEKGISAAVVSLPDGEDPDVFIRSHGKDAFLKKVEDSQGLIEFVLLQSVRSSASDSIDDKIKVIGELFPLLNLLKTKVEQSHYLKILSEELKISEVDLRAEFAKQTKKKGAPLQSRPAPSLKESKIPPDEEPLLALLLQGHLDPVALNGQLDLGDFIDARVRGILSHFWDARENRWRAPAHLNSIEEEFQPLYHRLLIGETDRETVKKVVNDCIFSLRAKRLRREGEEIQKKLKIAEKGGDVSLIHSLLQKHKDVTKELSLLSHFMSF